MASCRITEILHGRSSINTSDAISAGMVTFDGKDRDIDTFLNPRIPEVTRLFQVVNEIAAGSVSHHFKTSLPSPLTPREREVLTWLGIGYSYQEISDQLNVGVGTIRKHVQHLLLKLRARNSAHAVAIGIRWDLLHP